MPAPRINILSTNEIELVNSEAMKLLQEVGVKIANEDVNDLLIRNGCIPKGERTTIPESLIKEAVSKSPNSFDLYNRDGERITTLGTGSMMFDPGSAAIQILDYGNTVPRAPSLLDFKKLVILVDYLKNIQAQSTALVPDDVPIEIRDAVRLYVVLKYSSKPLITGSFTVKNIWTMFEMMKSIREDFNKRPWAIFDVTASSPLSWSNVTVSNLRDLATTGVPAEIISMPQMGATSPATIAGSLILHHAEVLSGLVIAQTSKPKSPVIYAGSTAVLHPKYAVPMITAPESLLLTLSYREMAKFLNVPSHTYMGISDSKSVDFQAGAESLYSATLSAISGFDVISGPGMMANELVQSLEKLVLDDEVIGIAKRLTRGYDMGREEIAIEVIRDVIARDTHNFFGQRHTKKFVRQEFYPTTIWDSTARASWDQRDSYAHAHDLVNKILDDHKPPLLSMEAQGKLDQVNSSLWGSINLEPMAI